MQTIVIVCTIEVVWRCIMQKLFDSELKVMDLLWANEPISAKDLSLLAESEYGWNKNTTYTVIKKIEAKGYLRRTDPGFVCVSLISKKDICESETFKNLRLSSGLS